MPGIAESRSFINYYTYKKTTAIEFFEQKRDAIRLAKTAETFDNNDAKWNRILSNAQKDFTLVNGKYVTEENLKNAISKSMDFNGNQLGRSLESMAQNINQLFIHGDKVAENTRKKYEDGYVEFNALWDAVRNSGRLVVQAAELQAMVDKLDSNMILNGIGDIANSLGNIGELAGLIQLSQIADNLLETSFKGMKNVKVELYNTGQYRTVDNQVLTTDNLMLIRDSKTGKVLFQLNLSNKINTQFKAEEQTSTRRAIKIRSTTVSAFVDQNPEYAEPTFNVYSYHWEGDKRFDWTVENVGVIARQTIGLQILYDHIYGTRGTFKLEDGLELKDEVGLLAYGNKIIATSSILKNALFNKAMKERAENRLIKAQIDRSSWFKTSDIENGPSNIINEWDAQKRIAKFGITYLQTLQL